MSYNEFTMKSSFTTESPLIRGPRAKFVMQNRSFTVNALTGYTINLQSCLGWIAPQAIFGVYGWCNFQEYITRSR